MTVTKGLLAAAALVLALSQAHAQGTRDTQRQGSRTASQGTGTAKSGDPMGGAMKGTGVPTFGTSSGMTDKSHSR